MLTEERFVTSSFSELMNRLESGRIDFPIVLSPEDNPVEASTFECVFDKDRLEKAFSFVSQLSETGRVSAGRLNIVE